MAQPKNVQAVLDWYRKHRPDMLPKIEQIVSSTHTEGFMAAALALLLQAHSMWDKEKLAAHQEAFEQAKQEAVCVCSPDGRMLHHGEHCPKISRNFCGAQKRFALGRKSKWDS